MHITINAPSLAAAEAVAQREYRRRTGSRRRAIIYKWSLDRLVMENGEVIAECLQSPLVTPTNKLGSSVVLAQIHVVVPIDNT